jgi:hypothetical protein
MFECPHCGRLLSTQSNLDQHLLKKVCRKTDRICPKCNRVFKRKENCLYHINQNVCGGNAPHKPKLVLKTKFDHMSRDQLVTELAHVTGQLDQMRGKYEALKENPQNVNNIIIFPSSFGKEDMEHIRQTLGDILKPMLTQHPFKSIPMLFNHIHMNEKLPEYHNVYVNSERSNYAMVSDGKNFKYKPKKNIIDQIIEDKRSILNRYVDENGEQLGERVLMKYDKYQSQIDDDSDFRKTLEVEIGGLLLDMKSVIADDEKTRQLLDKVNEGQYELTQ